MSEDIRQLRTGYNLDTQESRDDCENQAQTQMAYCMALDKLRVDLASNPKATLDDFFNPHLFGCMDTSEKIDMLKATHSILSQIEKLHCYCNTGGWSQS